MVICSGALDRIPTDRDDVVVLEKPFRYAQLIEAVWRSIDGYPVLHLKGTPYEVGYQHGALLKESVTENLNQIIHVQAEKELIDTQIKVDRQETQVVTAPRDGFILKLIANQGGQMVKEGDPLCVIVPDTAERAVQLWVKGIDAPLITPGSIVRLQFEGWPAVQFAGWPSVAVGTFGGNVTSVDATDNGKGEFRIVVQPDKADMAWPHDQYLRQGVRANGFILLKQVPLWYEIWRKMNGFPPTVAMPESEGKSLVKPKK